MGFIQETLPNFAPRYWHFNSGFYFAQAAKYLLTPLGL